jgi:EF-hand domain pair/EF hand
VERMRFAVATAVALSLAVAGCQSGFGEQTNEPPSPTRLEYIREFKKIDTTNKGRITLEEATAYYSARFTELDKNRDGYLDAKELEAIVPIMNSTSANELLLKLDRNSDNRVSRSEFLILANWLFQLASNPNELALGDVERNMPASVPASTKKDSDDSPARRTPCPAKVPYC